MDDEELDFEEIENIINEMLSDSIVIMALKKLKINHETAMEMMKDNIEENGLAQGDEETLRGACTRYIQTYILEAVAKKCFKKMIDEAELPEDFEGISVDEEKKNSYLDKYMQALEDGDYENLKKLLLANPKAIAYLMEDSVFEKLTPEQQQQLKKYVLPRMKSVNSALEEVSLEESIEDEQTEKISEQDLTNDESISQPEGQNFDNNTGNIDTENELETDFDYDKTNETSTFIEPANVYRPYEVKNTEYFQMHPEQQDATFVEAEAGTDIEIFAESLMMLQQNSETKIVGVFKGIPVDVSKYNTVAEIQGVLNEEMERGQDSSVREKGEFLEEARYYNQFLKKTDGPSTKSEIEEYNRSSSQYPSEEEISYSNIFEAKEGVDTKDFLEAVKHMDQADNLHGGKNYIKAYGMLICSSEFENAEELAKKIQEIGKVQAYNKEIEEHPEKHPNAKKQEIFIHSKSYYQSKVVVDRVATNEQVKEGNPAAKVIKASKTADPQSFAEAARYFGARNHNILAKGVRGEVLRSSEFETLEEQSLFMSEKDLSYIQKQRWKIEHPDDYEAGLENDRREFSFVNKITIQTGMKLDDIIADIEDFKSKGFDVTVDLFGNTLDTRMCQDVSEIRGLVQSTISKGQKTQVREQRIERETDVFESDVVGVDMEKNDSVLAALTEATLEGSNNGTGIERVARKMQEDGIDLGIIPQIKLEKDLSQEDSSKGDLHPETEVDEGR